MSYKITPSFFSLKYFGNGYSRPVHLHKITFDKCNFRCNFCDYTNRKACGYCDYSAVQFETIISELMHSSNYYKFTGGEPTINPELERDLAIVKKLGGHVFLDTNGSMPEITSNLMANGLIDVLGVSLKGINRHAAMQTANVTDSRLCWENVFLTLDAAQKLEVNTIVTMVFHEGVPLDSLFTFSDIIGKYTSVRMKINNLIPCDYQGEGTYSALSPSILEKAVKAFVNDNPIWKNRITLVSSPEAMKDNEKVIFL